MYIANLKAITQNKSIAKSQLCQKNEKTDWEKILAKDISGKRLLSEIYKELLKINSRKTKFDLKNN